MARHSVLRRAASSVLNSTRQWLTTAPLLQQGGQIGGPMPLRSSIASSPWRILGFGGAVSGGGVRSSAAGGSAALSNECNHHGGGGYNAATGIYTSQRSPIKLPRDSCMDLATFVLEGKNQESSKPALVDAQSGEVMTYDKLRHAVCSIELGLVSVGVRQGDVVLMVSKNSIYYPITFLATTSVGAVLAAVNPMSSAQEIKRQVQISGAQHVIVEQAYVDKVSGLGLPLVIIENGERIKVGDTEVPFSNLLELDPECQCAPEARIHQDDPAAILFSSGTTGTSKAVVLSHRNIMAQLLQLDAADDTPPGVHLCSLPMCHVFGLIVITLQQLYRGGTVVVTPKFELNNAMRCIDERKVTHLYAVPSIITNLIKITTTNNSSSSLSSLQRIMCGAAPLGREQVDEFCKLFPHVSFVQIYGLTETAGAMTLNNLKEDGTPASVGTLLSSVEAKVVGASQEVLAPNTQGELLLRGPNITKGYAKDEEANAASLDKDGWLRTGDLVSFDEEGRLFVVDRIKELIKYKANQVAPSELESLLLTHSDILDAAVVPLPNEEVGQIPVAFVVRSSGSSLTADVIKDFVAQRASYCVTSSSVQRTRTCRLPHSKKCGRSYSWMKFQRQRLEKFCVGSLQQSFCRLNKSYLFLLSKHYWVLRHQRAGCGKIKAGCRRWLIHSDEQILPRQPFWNAWSMLTAERVTYPWCNWLRQRIDQYEPVKCLA